LGARHVVSEQVVKLTSWVGMAPKKNRKQAEEAMPEEPAEDRVAPPESIGEEEPSLREDPLLMVYPCTKSAPTMH
jgi:hypothetical protein